MLWMWWRRALSCHSSLWMGWGYVRGKNWGYQRLPEQVNKKGSYLNDWQTFEESFFVFLLSSTEWPTKLLWHLTTISAAPFSFDEQEYTIQPTQSILWFSTSHRMRPLKYQSTHNTDSFGVVFFFFLKIWQKNNILTQKEHSEACPHLNTFYFKKWNELWWNDTVFLFFFILLMLRKLIFQSPSDLAPPQLVQKMYNPHIFH